VRTTAGVNANEGIGIIEAPRGLLIHHYRVNDDGAMAWANLIVATGHNNLAIGKSIRQVSERFIDGTKLTEGMINRVSAVIRAFDPCLSCSTHAIGEIAVNVRLVDARGDCSTSTRDEDDRHRMGQPCGATTRRAARRFLLPRSST
jgi:NAD-reducing hydrogenase large subunit